LIYAHISDWDKISKGRIINQDIDRAEGFLGSLNKPDTAALGGRIGLNG
jgi:hypothetical protein